jgi:hypothetical protein
MTVSMDKKYVTRNGKYDAKVVYILDKGQYPVVVVMTNKINGEISVIKMRSNGRLNMTSEDSFDLIEVPEEKPAPALDDYYNAFVYVWGDFSYTTTKERDKAGIKAVLELAGVKYMEKKG